MEKLHIEKKWNILNLENITKTFALEKGKEIQEEIAGLVKSAELDFKEHEDREDAEFLDFFKEAEKELELVKYLNSKNIFDVEIILSNDEPKSNKKSGKYNHVYKDFK